MTTENRRQPLIARVTVELTMSLEDGAVTMSRGTLQAALQHELSRTVVINHIDAWVEITGARVVRALTVDDPG